MTHVPEVAPGLIAGQIDVWRVDLRVASWRGLEETLSADERRRARRFRFERHRRRYVVSHSALRALLGRVSGLAHERIRYRAGPQGKPSLAIAGEAGDLRFNLARSGELALIALTRGLDVGVDVERVSGHREADAIARAYFTREEGAFIRAASPEDSAARFLRVWTRKEAVLKAAGLGLSGPIDGFSVLPCAAGWITVHAGPEFTGLLRDIDVGVDYVAALAVRGGVVPTMRLLGFPVPSTPPGRPS